jgi:hypothetical protein
MSAEDSFSLNDYVKISDWFFFVTLTLAEAYVFLKLKFNLDFSGKLTLLLHFTVSALRIFYGYFTTFGIWQTLFIGWSSTLVGMSLYYFVLELKLIQLTLLSSSFKETHIAKHKILTIRGLIFIFCIVYNVITSGFYIMKDFEMNDYVKILNPVLITARFLKIGIDFSMEYLFIVLLIFLLK